MDYPTIQVQTFYPGASPEVMTTSVTAPLERQFGQMPGLGQMSSVSSGGASVITLQFTLSLSLDVAEQEVQAAINAATNLLPSDLPAPPIYNKVNPADTPILTLALTSKTMSLTQVEDLADVRLAQKISQQPGVGLVSISGGNRPAVRVVVNPRALSAYGLAIDDVRTIIGTQNTDTPKGSFDGAAQNSTINDNDQLTSAEGYRNLIIAYKNGRPVRLGDIATVINGAENNQLSAWANRTPAVILNIQRQPGSNVIAVVKGIRALLPRLQSTMPAAVDITVLSDRTTTIRASVLDVEVELGLSVVLVVLVIFVFLRNLPATLIPSLSVPLSLVGTLAAMYLLGFSLDNLSLMSLTISTGFVVDDAIVMIENIARHVEDGGRAAGRRLARLRGDRVHHYLAHGVADRGADPASVHGRRRGTPVQRVCRDAFRHDHTFGRGVAHPGADAVRAAGAPPACRAPQPAGPRRRTLVQRFGIGLRAVAELGAGSAGIDLAGGGADARCHGRDVCRDPQGVLPCPGHQRHPGHLRGRAGHLVFRHGPGISSNSPTSSCKIRRWIACRRSSASMGTNTTLNAGRFLINLKPKGDRDLGVTGVIARLDQSVRKVAGVGLSLQPVQDLTVDSTVSRAQYHFFLENPDAGQFAPWVPKLVGALASNPGVRRCHRRHEHQWPCARHGG